MKSEDKQATFNAMKTYIAHYYYRSDAGKLEQNNMTISANSLAEAKRIAKARVGGPQTLRLVNVTEHHPQ